MKQIILILLFLTVSLFANEIDERKTDIYFGNGVWNSYAMAEAGMKKLQKKIDEGIINSDQKLKEKYGKLKLVYNWTGTSPDNDVDYSTQIFDVIETFYQLKKEGQLDDIMTIYDFIEEIMSRNKAGALITKTIDIIDTILDSYTSSITTNNIGDMLEKYDIESFYKSHRVLLIAHSQGNLFGNSVYDGLGWKQDYFKMVSIATPAKRVANGKTPYTTFKCDGIINNWIRTESLPVGIPGHLPGNMECSPVNEFDGDAHQLTKYYLSNSNSLSEIMQNVENQLLVLDTVPSQWKKDKEFGCACEKRIKVVHKEDSTLDINMSKEKVLSFDDVGKIYKLDGKYVKAATEGENVEKNDDKNICFNLLDANGTNIDMFYGTQKDYNPPSGLFKARLSWNETMVNMKLSNSLMSEESDGCGKTAIGSGDLDLYSVYPGTYAINVSADGYESLEGNISDLVTLNIRAVSAEKSDEFLVTNKYQYANLGKSGHIADIIISRTEDEEPSMEVIVPTTTTNSYGGGGGGGGGFGSGGSQPHYQGGKSYTPYTTLHPPKEICNESCGCLPCEYEILSYLNQARLGPISGADVRLYKATQEDKADREFIYEGQTVISSNIDEAGGMSLPVPYPQQTTYSEEEQAFMNAISDYDGDFILEISGGFDIDRDDNFEVDSSFTQLNGKLHLILSKKRLLENDYKVNILTEIAYQLSKDLLGSDYDKERLQGRLDDIASRVLIEKLYPSAQQNLGRDDLFYWLPMAHKNWLAKPYDTTLSPIVNKIYSGNDIYDDAYEYVYGESNSSAPIVKSQWIQVPEDIASGSEIGEIIVFNEGNSSIESYLLSGEGSELFSVENDGKVYLKENISLDYESTQMYELELKVKNISLESRPVTLNIIVNNILDAPEDNNFTGGIISEDATSGDFVAQVTFNEGNSPIEKIILGGNDAESFRVDLNGIISVSETATFDYETKNHADITLQAFNHSGGSQVIPIHITISDAVDIPIVKEMDVNLKEDVSSGHKVGVVEILTNDPLLSVVLSGSGSENFEVDLDGTISVANNASLDYESKANYVLHLEAENIQGKSRKGTVLIRLENVSDSPELIRTVLHITEYSSAGTEVGSVNIKTKGSSPITRYTLQGDGVENFEIDSDGVIKIVNANLSHNEQEYYNLFVTAINSSGESPKQIVVVYIDTQIPVLGMLSTYVYEDEEDERLLGTVPLKSSAFPIIAMSLEGVGAENFKINLNRELRIAPEAKLDYETTEYYTLKVIATNEIGESIPQPLYVRVLDRDDTIKIGGFSTTIAEDISKQSAIGYVSILNLGNDTIKGFELSGTGSENFNIDSSGLVSISTHSDFDDKVVKNYRIAVIAKGNVLQSSKAYIDINIVDSLNGQPTLLPFKESVTENSAIGTIVGKVTLVSLGSSAIESYTIEGDNADSFSVDTDGTIKVAKALDFETMEQYNFNIIAKNHLTQSAPTSVIIDIVNVPDVPPILEPFLGSVEENSPAHSVVGKIPILYTDDTNITKITLSGFGSENFYVETNGTLRVAENSNLDYELINKFSLEAIATNIIGNSQSVEIKVNLLDVGAVPILQSSSINVNVKTADSSAIGNIKIIALPEREVDKIELDGEGTERFRVDNTGKISLVNNLSSYENQNFILTAYPINQHGKGELVDVNISFYFEKPTLKSVVFTIDENSKTAVGSIPITAQGLAPITSIILSGVGSEYFNVSTDGLITVKENKIIDYEIVSGKIILNAVANNSYGQSEEVIITININNLIDPPTLLESEMSIDEHAPAGTLVGYLNVSENVDCAITSFESTSTKQSKFVYNVDKSVHVASDAILDYETAHNHTVKDTLIAHTECGDTNMATLKVNLNDLDENAEMGFGVLYGSEVIIYKIEENGNLTKEYTGRSNFDKYGKTDNDYRSVFNTHKYELEPDSYYLMEVSDGRELDLDYDGILDWLNKFEFKGKMRAIVKGSWLFDIPSIRLSPISEMLVDAIALQPEGFETDTLESRLAETVQKIARTDIDNDGEITVFDALQYNAISVYDPYVFLGDVKTIVNGSAEIGSVVGSIQTLGVHEGTSSSLKLVGEGSEYFTLENQNSLRVNHSLVDQSNKTFEFSVETTDEYNVTSVGDISVMVTPAMYLLGSYNTDGYVQKIEVTDDNKLLFAASGEAGVVILNIEDPKSPQLVAQFIDELDINDTGVNITSVALSHDGRTLYATNESDRSHLLVLDVSSPEQYNLLSSIAIETNFFPLVDFIVSADDNYVYVVGDMLEIIDVQNKISPQRVSRFNIYSEIFGHDIYKIELLTDEKMISASYLDEGMAFVYIDISNIQTPIWIYDEYDNVKHDYGSYRNNVTKNGVIGFGIGGGNNIYVIDLINLNEWGSQKIIMEFETPGNKNNIAISRDEEYLFLSCGEDGIQIIGFHP